MAEIDREWTALMQVIGRLTPQQMVAPDPGGWSPKDNLIHLATWMNFMLKSYLGGQPAHAAMGIDTKTFNGLEEDDINAIIFERNRDRSADDVLSELKNAYTETVKTLSDIRFENLMKPLRRDDPLQRPVIDWVVGNTSAHFAEHREYIERALRPSKS
jgi:hypothetical protein